MLILDEPTASLSAHEVERLFTIVRRLRDRGVAVLFVSHRLDEVFELCDRATVFRDGRHVVTTPTSELTTADLVRHMVGRAVSLFPKVETPIGDVLLEVEGLTRVGRLPRRRVLGARRRDRRVRRAGRGRADGGRAGPVRDRPARRRRDPARRPAGQLREPVGGDDGRDRLPARGSPPGGPGARLLDRPERDAADPAATLPAAPRPRVHRAGRGAATTPNSSTSG